MCYANLGSGAKVLRYVLQSGMLGVGAYLVVSDSASGGIMVASSIMMGRALAPVEVALGSWKQLVAARQGIARLRDICKMTARKPAAPPVALPRPCRELVRAGYLPSPRPATKGRSFPMSRFHSEAGMGLALLGASASGKTTLSKALVGIWPAQHGVVRLDGAAIDQWRDEDLGRHIGYLPQDVALFDGTVAENICRFDEAATSEAILKAARIAGVHDIILRLPEGYSTRIGQGGTSLSAGQRQRVGLARALSTAIPSSSSSTNPTPTSTPKARTHLARAIRILRQNNSIVIVVSHRPNALAMLEHGAGAL